VNIKFYHKVAVKNFSGKAVGKSLIYRVVHRHLQETTVQPAFQPKVTQSDMSVCHYECVAHCPPDDSKLLHLFHAAHPT